MSFNRGWMCKECGPVEESKKRTINKVQWDCCKTCGGIVMAWERPLNERSGRCGNCANASFSSAMVKGHLLRCCKVCKEVIDIDADCKIVRKGDKKHEYKQE